MSETIRDPSPLPESGLFEMKALGKLLGLHVGTVRGLLAENNIPYRRVGMKRFVEMSEFWNAFPKMIDRDDERARHGKHGLKPVRSFWCCSCRKRDGNGALVDRRHSRHVLKCRFCATQRPGGADDE